MTDWAIFLVLAWAGFSVAAWSMTLVRPQRPVTAGRAGAMGVLALGLFLGVVALSALFGTGPVLAGLGVCLAVVLARRALARRARTLHTVHRNPDGSHSYRPWPGWTEDDL